MDSDAFNNVIVKSLFCDTRGRDVAAYTTGFEVSSQDNFALNVIIIKVEYVTNVIEFVTNV